MKVVSKTGQFKGPFEANVNICERLSPTVASDGYFKHIGIQAMPGSLMKINNLSIQMGDSGTYELGENIKVYSIMFDTPRDDRTLIEYVYVYNDEYDEYSKDGSVMN